MSEIEVDTLPEKILSRRCANHSCGYCKGVGYRCGRVTCECACHGEELPESIADLKPSRPLGKVEANSRILEAYRRGRRDMSNEYWSIQNQSPDP